MSAPGDPPSRGPQPGAAYAYGEPGSPAQPERHRPWGWIVACGLLVVIAAGLGIWALGLSSDLDDQKDQAAQAQQQAEQANQQLDDIGQSVDEAADNLDQVGDNVEQALVELRAKLAEIKDQIEQGGAAAQPTATP